MKNKIRGSRIGGEESARPARRRINLLDIIFLLVIILVVFAVASFFMSVPLFGAGVREVEVSYTVELKFVNGAMAENIRIGDTVFDPTGKSPVGRVSDISRSDSTKFVYNQDAGMIEEAAFPANADGRVPQTMRITVVSVADYSAGGGYIIGGNRISVGSNFTLCFTGYSGAGVCVSLVAV